MNRQHMFGGTMHRERTDRFGLSESSRNPFESSTEHLTVAISPSVTAAHVTGTAHSRTSTAANVTTVPLYCLTIYGCRRQTQDPPFKNVKVKFTLEQFMKTQRESSGIALLFL
jgi:hypothetical protein